MPAIEFFITMRRCRISEMPIIWYLIIFVALLLITYFNYFDESTLFYAQGPENSLEKEFVSVPISKIMAGESIYLEQDDPKIIKYIWSKNLLEGPSTKEYALRSPNKDPSRGQAQFIRRILNNITNGFFVECGALDGETRSNTLFMEQHLGWKGLLVEGDPSNYAKMKRKHRKAWISNTCLSTKPHPHKARFFQSFSRGKVVDSNSQISQKRVVEVQCMPVFSLLSAINVTSVDYFSLDVEGSELKVLKTIPFDKIFIKTLSVEFKHTTEGKAALLKFMTKRDYVKVGIVRYPNNLANDFMFAHKSLNVKPQL